MKKATLALLLAILMLFASCRSNPDKPQTTPQQAETSTSEVTTPQTTPEETSASTPEETSASTPEETSASTPEETSASTPEETSASTPEETTPEAPPVYDYSNVDEDNTLKRACISTGSSEHEVYAGQELLKYLIQKIKTS